MTKNVLISGLVMAACSMALAKLPTPVLDDAAKAKAAETAARNAWQAKVDSYLLCRAQDKVVAQYKKTVATSASKDAKETKDTKDVKKVPVAAAKPASAASGTPVAMSATAAPCADPGPFAFNAPAEKPLETSGAHSPSGTAASPPSVKQPSAEMAPAKK